MTSGGESSCDPGTPTNLERVFGGRPVGGPADASNLERVFGGTCISVIWISFLVLKVGLPFFHDACSVSFAARAAASRRDSWIASPYMR